MIKKEAKSSNTINISSLKIKLIETATKTNTVYFVIEFILLKGRGRKSTAINAKYKRSKIKLPGGYMKFNNTIIENKKTDK
jgi:hypothetical protein